jgi:hypothetical protein
MTAHPTSAGARRLAAGRAPGHPAPSRHHRRGLVLLLAVAAVVGVALALPMAGRDQPDPRPAALDPASLVPTIAPVAPDAAVAAQLPPTVQPGTAALVAGPFSDAVELGALQLRPGDEATVTGTVRLTADVSTLLVMDLEAAWYDAAGALLGTSRTTLRQPDFTRAYDAGLIDARFGAALPFSVPAPVDVAGRAATATVGVPVLVNE